jgi:hypothetical protein
MYLLRQPFVSRAAQTARTGVRCALADLGTRAGSFRSGAAAGGLALALALFAAPSGAAADTSADAPEQAWAQPPANTPPKIVNFQAIPGAGGFWTISGDVIDKAPGGLTVSFGGEPESLQNLKTTTDANGHFSLTLLLATDGSDSGLASAQTVDSQGLVSNIALYNIYATGGQ